MKNIFEYYFFDNMYTLFLLDILHVEKICEILIYNINSFLQKKFGIKLRDGQGKWGL